MIKTLLATTGAVLLAATGLQAAPHGAAFGGGIHAAPGAAGARTQAIRPGANYSHAYRGGYGGYYGHGYYRGYGRRYYFFGGVPYFYDPFFFGFGYGYYGGFYGDPAGYGPYGYGYGNGGAYDGRVVDNRNGNNGAAPDPSALPKEVQRQLSKRGYYKGPSDGEFGPATKSALTRFQQDNKLRATGRVDGATLKALGFEDRGGSDGDNGR